MEMINMYSNFSTIHRHGHCHPHSGRQPDRYRS